MINWEKISLKELAGYLSEQLRQKGIETILGGFWSTQEGQKQKFLLFSELLQIRKQ